MTHRVEQLLGMALENVLASKWLQSLGKVPCIDLIGDRYYLEMPDAGFSVVASFDGNVSVCQMHSINHDGYKGFVDALPEGLSFEDGRQEVYRKLGIPSVSGGGNSSLLYGKSCIWDRYDRKLYSIHLQYSNEDGCINMVSMMRPDAVPGRIYKLNI